MPPIRQIAHGSKIASICTPFLRVFFQDTSGGIRDLRLDGDWCGGTMYDVVFQAKGNSPLALVQDAKGLLRLYCLAHDNTIQEHCWNGTSWYAGTSTDHNIVATAPYSNLAAIEWSKNLRVFYQETNNTIASLCCKIAEDKWFRLAIPISSVQPLPGTSIAAICWGNGSIRVYYQDVDGFIRELTFADGCHDGTLKCPAKLKTPITAIHYENSIRLYYLGEDNTVKEHCCDGADWFGGCIGSTPIIAAPYSSLAAVHWDENIRVYFQPASNPATIHECGKSRVGAWCTFKKFDISGMRRPHEFTDITGARCPAGVLPCILNPKTQRSYDPSAIESVGILVGLVNGELIGEDFTTKECKVLKENTANNSYTWVYAPGCAIIYRLADYDNLDSYTRHSQLRSGKHVVCAGEFRVNGVNGIDSVLVTMNDPRGRFKPDGGACLMHVSTKLATLGIDTADTDWYWK